MQPIFDEEVETWNSLYGGVQGGRYAVFQECARRRVRRRRALCVEMLAPAPGMAVLDLGCGSGMFRAPVEREGAHWTGLDLSFGMLAHGRRETGKDGSRARFVNGSGLALPFAEGTFDGILCVGVVNFHRPESVPRLLRETARVLRRGGTLVFTSIRLDVLTWARSRLYPGVPQPFSSPGPLYMLHYRKVLRLLEELPLACTDMMHISKYLGLPHYTLFKMTKGGS
ncbi:MAG: class I SAM-dependent methyltransferase [Desulfobacteraceae bacterium]|nr:class I SAM-dependent methyltransferase [Desulfobacteraceae bacterium]